MRLHRVHLLALLFLSCACASSAPATSPAKPTATSRSPCSEPLIELSASDMDPLALPAELLGSTPVARLVVEGADALPGHLLESAILAREGAPVKPETIHGDLQRLWRLEVFSDVRISAKATPEGITLRYQLAPKPTIAQVHITGDDTSRRGWPKLRLLEGTMLDRVLLYRYARRQERRYKRGGHLDVNVTVKLGQPNPTQGRDVCFDVAPGPRFTIRRIDIQGNGAVPDDELREVLTSNDTYNVVGGLLDEEDLNNVGVMRVMAHYMTLGYANVAVKPPEITRDLAEHHIHIALTVVEGDLYHVGSISFTNASGQPSDYIPHIALKTGDVFNYGLFREIPSTLSDLELKRGRNVTVIPHPKTDTKQRRVDVVFEFEEAP